MHLVGGCADDLFVAMPCSHGALVLVHPEKSVQRHNSKKSHRMHYVENSTIKTILKHYNIQIFILLYHTICATDEYC